MADSINIEIVSPEKLVLSAEVNSITVPGTEGYFTVMGEHAPLMTTLRPGFVTVNQSSGHDIFYVRGGFAEVSAGSLTILAEEATHIDDFERPQIEAAIKEARDALVAAQTEEDKQGAQFIVSSLENLLIEAQHVGPARAHQG